MAEHPDVAEEIRLTLTSLSPEEVVRLAQACLKRTELGALYLGLGQALTALDRHADAEAAHRRGLAIAEEPDVKSRLPVALASRPTDAGERDQLFGQAIELGGQSRGPGHGESGARPCTEALRLVLCQKM